ncbi:CPS1 (YJL172W) [Zygosaccharomyces parabailii]|nr:CPS1 (YJL172W) [Zygosaccharomyces parabailii]CDH11451.1 probable Carboxypeptidase S [Zygosaccharomyces bailii ISA1307]
MIVSDSKVNKGMQSANSLNRHKKLFVSLASVLTLGSWAVFGGINHNEFGVDVDLKNYSAPGCTKIEPLEPAFNKSVDLILNDEEYKKATIERFSGAIKIPTEVEDVHPSPADNPEYYKHFYEFHDYLEKIYPLVHEHLKLEKINELGLLYTWEGTNKDLQPLLLMAHQDVVPVNRKTWDEWDYPPFSGEYDKETDYIWGRGTIDCKNLLTAELEAIEQLLKDGYTPERTTIVSLGFDEESGGLLGAHELSKFLEERYGKDSIYSIVDEGGMVTAFDENLYLAAPVNTEKGYVDVRFTVNGHGGHSSSPPDHTTIGVAADLIFLFEKHPFKSEFTLDNPVYDFLTCVAEHSNRIPGSLKDDILNAPKSSKNKEHLTRFLASTKEFRDFIRTTRAVDIINGGIKANALPEVTSFLVNHRIDIHSSVNETLEKDLHFVMAIARKHGYGVFYNGEYLIPTTALGTIEVEITQSLEPAPVAPTSGPVWDVFAGTIQNVYENGVFADRDDIQFYVTSFLFTGNTDTRYYWNLSKNIYRFIASTGDETVLKTIHSVNEHISAQDHISAIAFIYQYIVNAGHAH